MPNIFSPRARTLAISAALVLLCAAMLPAGFGPARAQAPADSTGRRPALDPDSGIELIGRPAREFRFARWLRGGPLTPDSLRGKVVLIRFWTDDCRYCRNTLPAVETLRRRYADRGFVVLGAYHPHEPHPVTDAFVAKWAKQLGFGGPVAIDERWDTLNLWWLDGHPDRNWVSVSFLLDRDGVVRWVHGGGEYHPSRERLHRTCDASYHELEQQIETLLQ